jgi:hypothetical protein
MASFGAFEAEAAKAPLDRIILPTSAFNMAWSGAPSAPVCIGITLLSETDMERAQAAAAAEAWQMFPRPEDAESRINSLQDILLRWIVARGTCDPNDVSRPCELWAEAPDDLIGIALTVEGARALYVAIEKLQIATSPMMTMATDEDIAGFSEAAKLGMQSLPEWRAARIRRLITFCLDEFG